jgi:hypothetical protein
MIMIKNVRKLFSGFIQNFSDWVNAWFLKKYRKLSPIVLWSNQSFLRVHNICPEKWNMFKIFFKSFSYVCNILINFQLLSQLLMIKIMCLKIWVVIKTFWWGFIKNKQITLGANSPETILLKNIIFIRAKSN